MHYRLALENDQVYRTIHRCSMTRNHKMISINFKHTDANGLQSSTLQMPRTSITRARLPRCRFPVVIA
ncbi:unnamed protein product [Rotaria sordida]|uniref:Uncharacterized protein n=1 Tax=Rotaria sordida TaxID=392033 RepID=A0A819LPD6_9BILA|nr:unnamed protein product [Rotaria sordida]